MANLQTLKPFQPGYDPRRHIKQKGEISFKTAFYKAVKYLAKQKNKKVDVDDVIVEIVANGIKQALKGNFKFYKDLMDRLFGQAKQMETNTDTPLIILEDVKKI